MNIRRITQAQIIATNERTGSITAIRDFGARAAARPTSLRPSSTPFEWATASLFPRDQSARAAIRRQTKNSAFSIDAAQGRIVRAGSSLDFRAEA
jgi:hypothetical protein